MKTLTETLTLFAVLVIFCISVFGVAMFVTVVNTATSQDIEL